MMNHPTKSASPAGSTRRSMRAFTLIEIMVVVAIIVILAGMGVAVGVAVKRSSADRATKTTLKALDSVMSLYLKDNPEPSAANWLAALNANPATAKMLNSLPRGTPPGGSATPTGPAPVLDGYGNPIRFLPSNSVFNQANASWTAGPIPAPQGAMPRFQSLGPDGFIGADGITEIEKVGATTIDHSKDDVYSDGAAAQ